MTRDEILALDGRKLDAAVAEKVMGRKVHWANSEVGFYEIESSTSYFEGQRYSSDRNAAALVLAEIERRGRVDEFTRELRRELYRVHGDDDVMPQLWRFAAASPRDICRAALLAVEGE